MDRERREASTHASAVCTGDRAVLIRGPSGAGKSRLAFDLILAGRAGQIPNAVLIGDDRVHLEVRDGRLMVRPANVLEGLIEIRGLGIRACDHVPEAKVGLVVDLMAEDAARLPNANSLRIHLNGIELPRIPVGPGFSPFPLVVASFITTNTSCSGNL
jgi:serine kinase of HPr protein (carbohydrate metabolism regulator)